MAFEFEEGLAGLTDIEDADGGRVAREGSKKVGVVW